MSSYFLGVCRIAVLYCLCHGECSSKRFQLVLPSSTCVLALKVNCRVADIRSPTELFSSSFLCQSVKPWNTLPSTRGCLLLWSFNQGVKNFKGPPLCGSSILTMRIIQHGDTLAGSYSKKTKFFIS